MAQFQLLPCTPSDLDAMVDVYLRAFATNTLNQVLFPTPACYYSAPTRSFFRARFERAFTQGHAELHLFKLVEVASARLVAWARWGYPFVMTDLERRRREAQKASLEAESREAGPAGFPEGSNPEAFGVFLQAMEVMREKYVRCDEDYVCHLLVADPDFQRRGLGGMLLGHVITRADAEGRRIYLEATSAGHPLYERLGWRDVDVITIDLRKWKDDLLYRNSVMVREPQVKV